MAPPAERHTGLGKGLGALIPQTSPAGAAPTVWLASAVESATAVDEMPRFASCARSRPSAR